ARRLPPAARPPAWSPWRGAGGRAPRRLAAAGTPPPKPPQLVLTPDGTRHAKAAPFRRNDEMLAVLPIGVIVFPGSGISANLVDKAKKLGIPVWKYDGGA